jgi:hypothetical protein
MKENPCPIPCKDLNNKGIKACFNCDHTVKLRDGINITEC